MSGRVRVNWPWAIQFAGACLALLLGVLLYGLTRPDPVLFLAWVPVNLIGRWSPDSVLLNALPSFLHTFAFILLTGCVLNPNANGLRMICLAWVLIELVFELGQHSAFEPLLMQWSANGQAAVSMPALASDYFVYGRFDVFDVLAIMIGACAAYLTVIVSRNRWPVRG